MSQSLILETLSEAVREAREKERFLADVVLGLERKPKSIPCRYFYDEAGSRLFGEIMALPEYYLARCEAGILSRRKQDILGAMGRGPLYLLDLGAGNGEKTRILIEHFHAQGDLLGYIPADISGETLRLLAEGLRVDFPGLPVEPLEDTYFAALERFRPPRPARKLALFLGSNIGNFDSEECVGFLRGLRARLQAGDGLLTGFDLRKDAGTILRAYDDSAGVTARFNLNLLERINRELQGEFQAEFFRHRAVYDAEEGVARSYLVSLRDQMVQIGGAGRSFAFREGEAMHTENSRKFSPQEVERLARSAGFSIAAQYPDPDGLFLDSLWKVPR